METEATGFTQAAMRFFVDETSFVLPAGTSPVELEQHLEAFVSLVRARHDEEEDVFRWSRLEEVEVEPGKALANLIYGAASPIDRDTRLALQQAINRCVQWDDVLGDTPAPEVEIDGVGCTAQTVAVVHARLSGGQGAACLTLGARPDRTKACPVRAHEVSLEVHFVSKSAQLPVFYRTLFELEDLASDGYMENAREAFPDICFAPGLAAQFARFTTRYRDVRPIVTSHLSMLNDHFSRVFKKHDGKPFETQREIGAISGVDVSPESPKTRANKKAMKERDIDVGHVEIGRRLLHVGGTVTCEWHTKITPTADRVHFHPGAAGVAEGRLIVGIFARHLAV